MADDDWYKPHRPPAPSTRRIPPTPCFHPVEVPKLFFMAGVALRTPYDIAPDGRLVGHITAGHLEYVRSSVDQIQVVLNWFEELEKVSSKQSVHFPSVTLTLTIARRGSTKTVG